MSVSQAGTLGRELLVEAVDSPPPCHSGAQPSGGISPLCPTQQQQQLLQGREPHGTVGATGEAAAEKGAEGAESGGANLHIW